MADLKKLAEEIVGLTLLEAAELKKILKDEYGIEATAFTPASSSGVAPIAPPRTTSFLLSLVKASTAFAAATGSDE